MALLRREVVMRIRYFPSRPKPLLSIACTLGVMALLAGCSQDPVRPSASSLAGSGDRSVSGAREITAPGPPADIATVEFGGQTLHLWPYTGGSFDGTPSDPINLVFVGKADPRAIRAALLALDGDRTAFGYPNDYPFNATWSDANGDVQTSYADGEGWVGNVIQLQLGRYEFGRVHLRLFRTGSAFGDGGVWTLGGAHFEILIVFHHIDEGGHQVGQFVFPERAHGQLAHARLAILQSKAGKSLEGKDIIVNADLLNVFHDGLPPPGGHARPCVLQGSQVVVADV